MMKTAIVYRIKDNVIYVTYIDDRNVPKTDTVNIPQDNKVLILDDNSHPIYIDVSNIKMGDKIVLNQ